MATIDSYTVRDERHYGVNHVRLQERHFLIEAGLLADDGNVVVDLRDYAEGVGDTGFFPVVSAAGWTHTGGMSTGATATHVSSDGDTIVLEAKYPEFVDIVEQNQAEWVVITHTLAGVTGGAATPAEIAASLNADTEFAKYAYAAVTATNVLTVFPKGPNSQIRFGSGSTSIVVSDFTTNTANNAERVYTSIDPSDLSVVYDPDAWTVTIQNVSGGAVAKAAFVVSHI